MLLAEAWRAGTDADRREVADLAAALAGSRERHLETTQQGGAFGEAMAVWEGPGPMPDAIPGGPEAGATPYPVAVGLAARRHGVALEPALAAHLHAFASNLVQAAIRLVPLGQRDGVAALASLEPLLLAAARRAAASSLDDLGSATFMAEVMSLRHETQYSRVFRT